MNKEFDHSIDIIIGVPALNEESTIQDVVTALDKGLHKFYPDKVSLIILLDSNSTDRTVHIFNDTPSVTQKLVIKNKKHGKGRNIINLLKLAVAQNPKCVCMVDADISNIKDDWVRKLVEPVLKNDADFVFPLYRRGKFAGNITNLICRPLLYGLYGLFIVQPIGGDFAFSTEYARSILLRLKTIPKPIKTVINDFGIDIFMTFSCLSLGYKYCEVDLGEKIDKLGFFHIDQIFEEVCTVLFYLVANSSVDFSSKDVAKISTTKFILESNPYSDEELLKRLDMGLLYRKKQQAMMVNKKLYSGLNISALENKEQISSEEFNNLLLEITGILSSKRTSSKTYLEQLVNLLRPYFHIRIYTYFNEIKDKDPREVEGLLINTCEFIRNGLAVQKKSSLATTL